MKKLLVILIMLLTLSVCSKIDGPPQIIEVKTIESVVDLPTSNKTQTCQNTTKNDLEKCISCCIDVFTGCSTMQYFNENEIHRAFADRASKLFMFNIKETDFKSLILAECINKKEQNLILDAITRCADICPNGE